MSSTDDPPPLPPPPRTRTRQRITLVVPADASPQVLAFSKQVQALLGGVFVVRLETDEEITPVESSLKDFPFVVKIIG